MRAVPRFLPTLLAFGLLAGCHPPPTTGMGGQSFPLDGAHADLACGACHPADEPFGPLPEDCSGCHDAPAPHPWTGTCDDCHGVVTWIGARIAHDWLTLDEGHDLSCRACHERTFEYDAVDAACSSCHEEERPPGHYSGDCAECHWPSEWRRASFAHQAFFPLPHAGRHDCALCHPPASFDADCLGCHDHGEALMAIAHEGQLGYRWESQACLRCHPDG